MISVTLLIVALSVGHISNAAFQIPEVSVKVLQPTGFEVSIPDEQGIVLFAFHGKINTALRSAEAGSFSQDIRSATKGRWIFTDNSTPLKPGDILYYWVYVEHNDGSGVRGYPSIIQTYKVPNQSAEKTNPGTTSSVNPKIATDECNPTETTVSGTLKPAQLCSGQLIFSDEFDTLDFEKWEHEKTLAGGGNWEFQWYTNNRSNSFVKDGALNIHPTLLSDQYGEGFLTSGTIDLNGGDPADQCTNAANYGCIRSGNGDNILNPIKSARIRTVNTFSFRYGRIEVRAKTPQGDWLWPAIWLMPRYNAYGGWPTSGEIDLLESRGNLQLSINGNQIGAQQVSSTLHFGPDPNHNGFMNAHFEKNSNNGYYDTFHDYKLEWSPDSLKFYYDNELVGTVAPPGGGFWELGGFQNSGIQNPWSGASKMAPFDQQFYLIINLAVGGTTGFFPDIASNPNGKPWSNTSPTAARDFWNGRNNWLPTWNLNSNDNANFKIDYVRIYAL